MNSINYGNSTAHETTAEVWLEPSLLRISGDKAGEINCQEKDFPHKLYFESPPFPLLP